MGDTSMRVGIAADHAGLVLKDALAEKLRQAGFEVVDFSHTSWRRTTIIPTW